MTYEGTVTLGALKFLVLPALGKLEGWHFRIEFWHGKRRSNRQNRYYNGVILPKIHDMMRDAGVTISRKACHEWLKKRVGNLVVNFELPDGTIEEVTRSSAELSTQEWEDFMLACRVWAAEWGLDIPPPNEG